MDRERFQILAEAFGADLRRWPDAERDAAEALRAADGAFAAQALAEADRLDAALDAWRPMTVSADLREAVVGAAPAMRPRRLLARWALGAGLACACAAGVAVGAANPDFTTNPNADAVTAAANGYELPGDDAAVSEDV
jgi:ferric-dicitrate binding protein FerR (iron transport regulator)